MYNVDIDTGGTMTDGLVSGNGRVLALKVETTPRSPSSTSWRRLAKRSVSPTYVRCSPRSK